MTGFDLPDPLTVESLDAWLTGREDALAATLDEAIDTILVPRLERYVAALTAAADPSLLDGISVAWRTLVNGAVAESLSDTYINGAAGAYLTSPGVDVIDGNRFAAVVNDQAVDYVRNATNRISGASDIMWGEVRERVATNLGSGKAIPDLRAEVEQVTGYARERAQTIARTETLGAYNGGDWDGTMALPEEFRPVEKAWLATNDSRTRKSHKRADGQTVPIDEPFRVGGHSMMRPHDSGAPASEVVNCRCTTQTFYPGDKRPDGSLVEGGTAPTEPVASVETGSTTEQTWMTTSDSGRPEWNPARRTDVHDPYVDNLLSTGVKHDEPRMTFMGGGSGAGKGSIQKQGKMSLRDGTVVVDSDDAKLAIPEYRQLVAAGDTRAAALAHDESSYLAKRSIAESLDAGYDTMLDGTGNSSIEKLSGKVADARKRGAKRVVAEYVTIDTDEAIRRATSRAARTGREVPLDIITGTHESVSGVFPQAAKSDLFDELRLWDNMGDEPRLIYSRIDGVEEILDADRWEAFLRKSPDHPGYVPHTATP